MYLFHNDYNELCHPAVMTHIEKYRRSQMQGYGLDQCSHQAADLIRRECGRDDLDVHFLVGGTQTNLTVIAAALRPHEAVICAHSGHINVHETGAVEATGHKIIPVSSDDGKITALQVARLAAAQEADENAEHNVRIGMVYISHPTELGTIYTHAELSELSDVCKQYGLSLFMDGARLAYALSAEGNDLNLADIAMLCDVFYIGGTKCGAMLGEAVVISNPEIKRGFRYIIKQRGAMLAKGWLIGMQFEALFRDGLYQSLATRANHFADKIRSEVKRLGYDSLLINQTNQVFPILPNGLLNQLSNNFTFLIQEKIDDTHQAVRFCTSWSTTEAAVKALCAELERLTKHREG